MSIVSDSYQNDREETRLTTNNARRIEFINTIRALEDIFPPNGKILDCAAGAGIYSFYFADKGYDVTALDLTLRHINIINKIIMDKPYSMYTAVNDATNLSRFNDEIFDIVLCMGPMYHIAEKEKRCKCLSECKRVLKNGGLLVVAYISRFFIFPQIALNDKKYFSMKFANALVKEGTIDQNDPNFFWTESYFHTPEEIEKDIKNLNMTIADHLAADGLSPLLWLRDAVDKMNEDEFKLWCDYQYMISREKSMLGSSNHGIVIGRK